MLDRTPGPQREVTLPFSVACNDFILEKYEDLSHRAMIELFGGLSQKELRDTARLLDRLSVSIVDKDDEVCFRCGIHFRDRCLLRQARRRDCYFHLHKKPKRKQLGGTELQSK